MGLQCRCEVSVKLIKVLNSTHEFILSYQKWAQNLKDERLTEIIEAKRQSENFVIFPHPQC